MKLIRHYLASSQLLSMLFLTGVAVLLLSFSPFLVAAQSEKSNIRSDESFLQENKFIYQGNVLYEHDNLEIKAETLIRENKERKKVTVTGNPAKVFYTDNQGEQTEIFAPAIYYWEDSGEILASGPIDIKQTSKQDRLRLFGNELKANRQVSSGFSFKLTGTPTRFELQQPGLEHIKATANSLSSNGKGRKTLLKGNVKLRQGDSYMAAATITYDGETGLVSAKQSQDGSQRVETEFFWDDENQKPPTEENPQASESENTDDNNN
ncbi:LptA/OstA family protein [Kangiella sp. TOML190]|uniref:LptA/OstA family protein n=1 Tax=Kangiella sp. TOML190 TaxID=2931351 RepID=UPI00203DE76E|nr:LptA/OstA family protein [Kangiella sp. TOML190]